MLTELADLEHAVDLALKESAHELSASGKAEALEALSRIRNKVDALDGGVITAFEATREHKAEGHASVIGWLQHHCHQQHDTGAARKRTARRLLDHPVAAEALAEGEITVRHLDKLDHCRRRVGPDAYRDAEALLVDAAREKRFCEFARAVDYFIAHLDAAAGNEADERLERDRWASASVSIDGHGAVDAWLPALGFAEFKAELDRLVNHLHAVDRAEALDRLGREPSSDELARTAGQRRADALVLMARRSAGFSGEVGPAPFMLHVHADAVLVASLVKVLTDALGDPDLDLDAAVDGIELTQDSLHELHDGTVVSVNTVMLALLTGTVRGYWHDPDGVALRYGRARRFFTPDQALAGRARHRRCAHPYGCDRTTGLEANHQTPYRTGGTTDIDHLDPRCGPHNRWHDTTWDQPPPPGPTDTDHHRRPPPLRPDPDPPDQ